MEPFTHSPNERELLASGVTLEEVLAMRRLELEAHDSRPDDEAAALAAAIAASLNDPAARAEGEDVAALEAALAESMLLAGSERGRPDPSEEDLAAALAESLAAPAAHDFEADDAASLSAALAASLACEKLGNVLSRHDPRRLQGIQASRDGAAEAAEAAALRASTFEAVLDKARRRAGGSSAALPGGEGATLPRDPHAGPASAGASTGEVSAGAAASSAGEELAARLAARRAMQGEE